MSPEQSRRVDAALDQLRALQRPNPHQPVLLDTRGSTARVAHQEATVATPEIKPPDEEFDEIGQDPVGAEVLAPGRSAFTDDQMPWATSHSTRISPRTCSGTWSPVATVMIVAENRTATQAEAASAWLGSTESLGRGCPPEHSTRAVVDFRGDRVERVLGERAGRRSCAGIGAAADWCSRWCLVGQLQAHVSAMHSNVDQGAEVMCMSGTRPNRSDITVERLRRIATERRSGTDSRQTRNGAGGTNSRRERSRGGASPSISASHSTSAVRCISPRITLSSQDRHRTPMLKFIGYP